MRNTVLEERLRNAKPDYIPVNKEKILSQLNISAWKSRKNGKSITVIKSAGVALSGIAAVTVVCMNIPIHHSSSHLPATTAAGGTASSTSTTNTTSSASTTSATSTAKASYSYLGIKASLQAMIPTAVTSRFNLKGADLDINLGPKAAESDRYNALYSNPKDHTEMMINEQPGNSITDDTGGMATTLGWQQTVSVKNQTYYLHSSKGLMGNLVGFVKDHVVYELASNMPENALLKSVEESAFKPAPVTQVDRLSDNNYNDAVRNISFQPISPPASLSSDWVVKGAISDFERIENGMTYPSLMIEYAQRNNSNKIVDVYEDPLKSLQNNIPPGFIGVARTWDDSKHGLQIQVVSDLGKITVPEINQILDAFKAGK